MTLDIQKLTSLSDEARQAVAEAFDAVEHWQKEVLDANERCLTKVVDHVTKVHRALGWPEQATTTVKKHFLEASSIQSKMIEQAMELWLRQISTANYNQRTPRSMFSTPSQFISPTSEMTGFGEMALAPFMLWIEAAQAWQRAWISTMSGGALTESSSMIPSRRMESSTREGRPIR